MSFGISDKQVKEYFQKEYDEKHTPFSVIALVVLNDFEKGTVSPLSQEEIDAMRTILKQNPAEGDGFWYSILDEYEAKLKMG